MIFQLFLLVAIATSDVICSNDLIVSASEPSESDTENDVIINNGKPMKTFVPTKEWQVVHDDEAIPAGLHVRMNFQTGVKEAKILEDDTKIEDKNIVAPTEILETKEDRKNENIGPKIIMSEESKPLHEFVKDDEKIYFTKSHLKEALKEFRDKVGNKDVEEISWDEKDLERLVPNQNVKKKFRSIEEIRDELEDSMGWKIKSDVQIMKDHLSILENDDVTANDIGTMLDNLEYYVHQIDNGKDLVRINGILPIVLLLNQTNEVLQQKAANVIGAAAQSNREVQNSVVNNGGLTLLMRMLNAKKLPLTKKKGLYALSAVVRGNTNAQQKLSRFDGFSRILQIIDDERNGALRVKAVTLLSDLIVEQREQIEKLVKQGKKNQLDKFPLMDMLLQNNWCNILPPLLKADDYDTIEKILQAVTVSVEPCRDVFKKHLDVWKTTNKRLSKDISSEDDQDFKSYLESLQKILKDNIMKDF